MINIQELLKIQPYVLGWAQEANAMKAIAQYLALPGLRAFWPGGVRNESQWVVDISGQGRILANVGVSMPILSSGLPVMGFNGSTSRLYRADEAGLDITDALTMGGWFVTSTPGSYFLMGRGDGSTLAGTAYRVSWLASSSNTQIIPADLSGLISLNNGIAPGTSWNFIAMRFTPSSELALFANGVFTRQSAGIPATLNNTSSEFRVGMNSSNGQPFLGCAALLFLCATALSDATLLDLYQSTRGLFGV
jgi:hypothetical protein